MDNIVGTCVCFLPQLLAALVYVKQLNSVGNGQQIYNQILWGITLLTIPANAMLFYDLRAFSIMLFFLAPLPSIIGSVCFFWKHNWMRGLGLLLLAMCCAFQTILFMAVQQ